MCLGDVLPQQQFGGVGAGVRVGLCHQVLPAGVHRRSHLWMRQHSSRHTNTLQPGNEVATGVMHAAMPKSGSRCE